MEFTRVDDDVLLRLDPGEEIHESIQRLNVNGITSAVITSGIGRCHDVEIGYLNSQRIYQKVLHQDSMELLSTQGNLAPGPDGPFTHLHVVLADDEHLVHGGHLFRATVSVTAEIHLRVLSRDLGSDMICRVADESEFVQLRFKEE
ncbi:MAG: PPC domain-containing DNA-binding protein [Candidatus Poseidoniales archaeon]|jgi:predicted DNA-binding protein with PD1-like motif|tara:strand:- start:398 stop:835 length:438 start_codon:yes stop_codon:yes gene_type:complete